MLFQSILDRVSKLEKFEDKFLDLLQNFDNEKEVELKTKKGTFKGFRIQHNNLRGPYKGGVRYHPSVTKEELKNLSFEMTLKTSLANIPFGGSKGGINVNPKDLTQKELEELTRLFIQKIAGVIGPYQDIPAPDVGTNSQIMAWMMDEYSQIKGENIPGVVTGKPPELGGMQLRPQATALGGFYVIQEVLKTYPLKDKRVAIQGFGHVGHFTADFLNQAGFKIIALSDSKGGILNPKGLNPHKIIDVKEKRGTVQAFKEGEKITNEELLKLDCGLLVPAAFENQITKKNASLVKAKLILELANNPIDIEANDILIDNNTTIIPDILANSGGVIISYFEWVQNLQRLNWDEEEINQRLQSMMKNAWEEILHYSLSLNCSLREGAFFAALNRLHKAAKLRGRI